MGRILAITDDDMTQVLDFPLVASLVYEKAKERGLGAWVEM